MERQRKAIHFLLQESKSRRVGFKKQSLPHTLRDLRGKTILQRDVKMKHLISTEIEFQTWMKKEPRTISGASCLTEIETKEEDQSTRFYQTRVVQLVKTKDFFLYKDSHVYMKVKELTTERFHQSLDRRTERKTHLGLKIPVSAHKW